MSDDPQYVGPPISDPIPDPPPDDGDDPPIVSESIVAEIADPPDAGNFAPQDFPYQAWGQVCIIERDSGWRTQAVGDARASKIQIHGGWGRKTIQGVAIRVGADPQLPSSDTQSANEVLVGERSAHFTAQLTPGGQRAKAVVWEYVYELIVPFLQSDAVTYGKPPSDAGDPAVANPADYLSNLNGPSQNPAGFTG